MINHDFPYTIPKGNDSGGLPEVRSVTELFVRTAYGPVMGTKRSNLMIESAFRVATAESDIMDLVQTSI